MCIRDRDNLLEEDVDAESFVCLAGLDAVLSLGDLDIGGCSFLSSGAVGLPADVDLGASFVCLAGLDAVLSLADLDFCCSFLSCGVALPAYLAVDLLEEDVDAVSFGLAAGVLSADEDVLAAFMEDSDAAVVDCKKKIRSAAIRSFKVTISFLLVVLIGIKGPQHPPG